MSDKEFFECKWLEATDYKKQQNKSKFRSDNGKSLNLKVK